MRDKTYWETYYKSHRTPKRDFSLFAKFVLETYLRPLLKTKDLESLSLRAQQPEAIQGEAQAFQLTSSLRGGAKHNEAIHKIQTTESANFTQKTQTTNKESARSAALPPFAEKAAAFSGQGGAGRGEYPFLRKEKDLESFGKAGISDSVGNILNNKESHRKAKIRDSVKQILNKIFHKKDTSFASLSQYDKIDSMDCHEFSSENSRNDGVDSVDSTHPLAFGEGEYTALDSKNPAIATANSSIFDEKSRFSSARQGSYLVGNDRSRVRRIADFSLKDEFAPLKLLELGCGNGRDSLYFAKHGIKVTAIDQAHDEIAYLQNLIKTSDNADNRANADKRENPRFVYGDFTQLHATLGIPKAKNLDCYANIFNDEKSIDSTNRAIANEDSKNLVNPNAESSDSPRGRILDEISGLSFALLTSLFKKCEASEEIELRGSLTKRGEALPEISLKANALTFDCIYSRFTLHSIDKTSQDKVLQAALELLSEGGILAIEARGLKNSLYGIGEALKGEKDAFIYDNHYRRFLDFERTIQEIKSLRCDSSLGNHSQGETIPQSNTANTKIVLESSVDSKKIIKSSADSMGGGGAK